MGGGSWSTDVHTARSSALAASGKSAFDYSSNTLMQRREDQKPHTLLDPKGVDVRESRDSADHPTSLPIAVMLDVTGSMRQIPTQIREKLPDLLGLLLRKGYAEHPHIMFGAIGDATCDAIPLQVAQFEADNRMDEQLSSFVLEGGGGGQKMESYELGFYFLARHTVLDSVEKRSKKGYAFFIGDEMAYPAVKKSEVTSIIDDGLEGDVPLADIVAEMQEKYEVYFIFPTGAGHGGDPEVIKFWRDLFGQNLLFIEDPIAIAETIATVVGLAEGAVSLDGATKDLAEMACDPKTIDCVSRSLTSLA